ncbi:MAG: oligosaccharide flippase family protein [Limisphaerales bacterium]
MIPSFSGLRRLKQSRFARDAFSMTAGTAVAQAITLMCAPVLSRIYRPEEYGLFGIYSAFVVILGTVTAGCFELAIQLPKSGRLARDVTYLAFVISIWTALFAWVFAFLAAPSVAALLGTPEVEKILWLVPLGALGSATFAVLRLYTMRRSAFSLIGINAVFRTTAANALNISSGLLIHPSGILLAAGGLLADFVGNGFLLFKALPSLGKPGLRRRWLRLCAAFARYWPLARTLIYSHLLCIVYMRVPIFGISWLYGTELLGNYFQAERFTSLPTLLIAGAVGEVYRQRATVQWQQRGGFRGLMVKTTLWLAAVAIVPYLLAIFLAPSLFPWLLGEKWGQAGHLAGILLIAGLAQFVITPVDKGGLIVQAKAYMAVWHTARFFCECGVLLLTAWQHWGIEQYLWAIVATRILFYAVEWVACYHFARH